MKNGENAKQPETCNRRQRHQQPLPVQRGKQPCIGPRWPYAVYQTREVPHIVLKGLVEDVGKWSRPGRVAGSMLREWSFGGGTVLMRRRRHRLSTDIAL